MSATRTLPALLVITLSLTSLALAQQRDGTGRKTASMAAFEAAPPDIQSLQSLTGAETACTGGSAAGYACSQIDLLSFMDLGAFGASGVNDIWGWTDPVTGDEYALLGTHQGTAFIDVTDPVNPVLVGTLPTHTFASSWRDIKVYADHAFIVSEASGHGVQVFDLTQLRTATPPQTFTNTAHYSGVADVHNIVINEATGFAYTVGNNGGGTTCAGGLHMINIQNPSSPTFAGCFSDDGYTHDAQCVIYNGPDVEHQGKEICVALNEDTITIVDVTNKSAPVQLGRMSYPGATYVHQGWFDEQQVYFYEDDEVDTGNTRTIIWDLADLDDPVVASNYYAVLSSRDHNQYVVGDLLYQSNYTAGLRILDISDRQSPVEIAYFDTYSPNDGTSYSGSWSNYPFFESGTIVVSSIGEGLFVLRHNTSTEPPPVPTEIFVDALTLDTQGGKKRQRGTATVTVLGDLGDPVSGATVTGTFSGAFSESGSGITDATGSVTIVTNEQTPNPTFAFCVDDVAGALPYNEAANSDPSFACDGGGDPGGDPESVHVALVVIGQQNAGQGAKRGQAEVTIVSDLGSPASGVEVTGAFSGDFLESGVSATTNGSGVATLLTSGTKKGSLTIDFCVEDVVDPVLPYAVADNTDPTYQCSAGKRWRLGGSETTPETFTLGQNYPNPFNPSTVISFGLPEAGNVTLTVFDMLGRQIETLVDGFLEAGEHQVMFEAGDLPAGTYLYEIRSGPFTSTQRMILLR